MNINIEHLPLKLREEFAEEGITDKIKDIRYNHYDKRRLKLLDLLH